MRVKKFFFSIGLLSFILGDPADAQPDGASIPRAYKLTGTVRDDAGRPVPSAELAISQDGRSTNVVRTDPTGSFSVDNLASGPALVRSRRLGFKARATTLILGGTEHAATVEIVLEPIPADVGPVLVTGTSSRMKRFYEDRRHNGFAHFFDQREIEKLGARVTSDLLRTIPGAYVRSSGRFGNIVRLRGCRPKIWLDGVPLDAELDDVTTPGEIAGLEVYPSSPAVPPEYMDARGCGVIVVWTRVD